jgi:hypothetical protein
MNARSLLTKAGLAAGAITILATGAAASASAATTTAHAQRAVTATTQISNRYDGGGGGNWAYDKFGRVLAVTYLGKSLDPAHAAAPYEYSATLTDNGTFRDIPGALTPNQGAPYTGRVLRPGQVTGTMSGYGYFGVFYASQKAHAGLVPTRLNGTALNSLYPSSTWPELAFPQGTLFSGVNEGWYSYTYTVTLKNGTKVTVQRWVDSAANGDGQLKYDGNITGSR